MAMRSPTTRTGYRLTRAAWLRSACYITAVASALAVVAPLGAQSSISFGAGFGSFTGGDLSGTPSGPTFGGAYHIAFEDYPFEAAFGIDYSRYGDHGFVGQTKQLDYSGSLRQPVPIGRARILVGGKLGFSTRTLSVVEEPARTEGFLIGPSLSLRGPSGPGASLDLSLDVLYHAYEELIMYASREYGTDQDGFRVVLRLGLLLPIPTLGGGNNDGEPPHRR